MSGVARSPAGAELAQADSSSASPRETSAAFDLLPPAMRQRSTETSQPEIARGAESAGQPSKRALGSDDGHDRGAEHHHDRSSGEELEGQHGHVKPSSTPRAALATLPEDALATRGVDVLVVDDTPQNLVAVEAAL